MKLGIGSFALLLTIANGASASAIDVFLDSSNGQTVAPAALGPAGSFSSTSWVFGEVDTLPGHAGQLMYANGVGVTNVGPDTFDLSLYAGVWAADGAGGGPGTLLDIAYSNPISLPPGSFFAFVYSNWVIPSGDFWLGFAFANPLSPATTAAELGELRFNEANAPSIGTTSHAALLGSAVGTLGNNPAISSTLPGDNAQFIQIYAPDAPEPATTGLLLGGLLTLGALFRRRKGSRGTLAE